jgi:aminoglycoside 6'-N-acetyltransferase I
MKIISVQDEHKGVWMKMRDDLYPLHPEAFHAAEMQLYHHADDKECYLAVDEDSEEAVGMIELSLRNVVDGFTSSPVGYIEGIYVVPEFRGLGTGKALLAQAIRWFKRLGCTEMATDACR